jgi:hypothetical protein
MKKILFIMVSLFMVSANAQTFGFQAGVHQSNAESDPGDDTKDATLNYRIGLLGLIDLTDRVYFRTGATYTTRYLNFGNSTFESDAKLAYLDIPVLFQFQFTEIFSLYAGGVVGFNTSKKFEQSGAGAVSGEIDDVESMLILGQVGLNFMFDGIGFDVYYERSMTDLVGTDGGTQSDITNFNSIGANFVMLF